MAHHPIASWLGVIAFALLMGVATFGVINAFVMRFKQVKLAKRPEIRWDEIPQRIKNVMVYVLGQKRLPRNGYTYSGVLHMFIFGAFVVLSVDTTNFVLDGTFRMFDVILGNQPGGPFHLPGSDGPYQGLADTFRFLCIVGLGMALVNRTIIKPARLPLTRDALYTLAFIFGLMFFEAIQTGAQMALTPGMAEAKPYIWFSGLFASAFSGLETETVALIYKGAWWLHLANLLAFTNYVPYSKHSHVFGAPLNIFFMSLEPKGALRKMEINIEDEENAPEYFGARNLEDLSWKQVFDGLACTECGRCTDNCPAALSGKPLKPMHIIVDLKHHMEDRWKKRGEKFDLAEDGAVLLTTPDNKGIIDPDVLWSCTTCRACMEVCPVGNEHIPAIVDMRRYLTMGQGSVGHGADGALKKMDRRGNPWGMNKRDRVKWADGLDIPLWDAEKPAEYLYWVGCAGAFDNRAQKVTKSVSRLMKKAGVDFAILGNDESCTGDSARRLGDEYLFQNLATQNVETLNSSGVKKIVTHCPHCFNTLKNEYGQFGGQYEVIHHSELLAKLMSEGKLKLDQDQGEQTIIYHDSCYLGRYNEIYDPQRDIIDAMPKVKRIEADRARQRGLCCGAGGGQMWMEMDIGTRMNYVRTDELLAKKPDVIAVACNFCMTMVEDGVKARSKEDEVQVLDLAELLDRRIAADVAAEEATEG
ncbi:MAG: 4Fe-4S dicluster domain-containing protein [Myxococcales bacterium]|nr:4Fe-4S dicluster domain-containing protein [Myxococcales bacterium]